VIAVPRIIMAARIVRGVAGTFMLLRRTRPLLVHGLGHARSRLARRLVLGLMLHLWTRRLRVE
jgi:hypothetical protein